MTAPIDLIAARMRELIISLEEARARGTEYYFTGEPCTNGHVVERFVSTGRCTECRRVAVQKYRDNNRELLRTKNSDKKKKAAAALRALKDFGVEL